MTDEILDVTEFSDDGDSWAAVCPHCNRVLGLDKTEPIRGEQFQDRICGGWLGVTHDAKRVKEVHPRPTAWVEWSLTVECPKCKEDFDLADNDDDNVFSGAIFTNKWDALKGADATCPHCEHEFLIAGVEY